MGHLSRTMEVITLSVSALDVAKKLLTQLNGDGTLRLMDRVLNRERTFDSSMEFSNASGLSTREFVLRLNAIKKTNDQMGTKILEKVRPYVTNQQNEEDDEILQELGFSNLDDTKQKFTREDTIETGARNSRRHMVTYLGVIIIERKIVDRVASWNFMLGYVVNEISDDTFQQQFEGLKAITVNQIHSRFLNVFPDKFKMKVTDN